ncbi:MAG: suppressor of fused domain protein [Planctomycetota bacterium]
MVRPRLKRPPALVRRVYADHIEHFGEPARAVMYDASTRTPEAPEAPDLLVMVWRPEKGCPMTTFATIGASTRAMPGTTRRIELHFSVRGRLPAKVEDAVTRFLANLSIYPWDQRQVLGWWHTLSSVGEIPGFPKCCAILLHPRFTEKGWDTVKHGRTEVRLLNAVPITENELEVARVDLSALVGRWAEDEIDIFVDRKRQGRKPSRRARR